MVSESVFVCVRVSATCVCKDGSVAHGVFGDELYAHIMLQTTSMTRYTSCYGSDTASF
jgi:hypothetical protein